MPAPIVDQLPVGLLQCNCIVLGDPATKRAIVVDPGDEAERIAALLEHHGLTVAAIVATHAHIDHVGGLAVLKKLAGAPVMMHEADVPLYEGMEEQAAWLGIPAPETTRVDRYIGDQASVDFGSLALRVDHTPGHTPGSVTLSVAVAKPLVLSGDTLFAGSIGRTDLWGGSFEEIMRSLKTKLLAFPDESVVIPGHGPQTTIGSERRTNPFLI